MEFARISRVLIGQTQIAKITDILTRAVHEALGDILSYSVALKSGTRVLPGSNSKMVGRSYFVEKR